MINRQSIKQDSKKIMKAEGVLFGMIGADVLNCILVALLSIAGYVISILLGSVILMIPILGLVLVGPFSSLVMNMVVSPADVGLNKYYLNILTTRAKVSPGTITDCFPHFWSIAKSYAVRTLFLSLIPTVLTLIEVIILSIISGGILTFAGIFSGMDFMSIADNIFGSISLLVDGYAVIIAVFAILQFVSYFIMTLMAWAVPWIIANNPEAKAIDALKQSLSLTSGHLWEIFVFELSFIGWHILGALTFGIVRLLYGRPYYQTSCAGLYAVLAGNNKTGSGSTASQRSGNTGHSHGGVASSSEMKTTIISNTTDSNRKTEHIADVSHYRAAIYGISGNYNGKKFILHPDQKYFIGRDPASCSIVLQGSQLISRKHCCIVFNSSTNTYILTDLSKNGTYVNGKRLMQNTPVSLPHGAIIIIGSKEYSFRLY